MLFDFVFHRFDSKVQMKTFHLLRADRMQDRYEVKFKNVSYSISVQKTLAIIMIVAVLLRVASAFYQGNEVIDLPGVYDQISYDGLARRVVAGYGFSFEEGHWPATRPGEPTAHWSYLYTLYLAMIYKVFGTYPLIARVVQALIAGVFQTILIYRLGARIFDKPVGLIAASLNAVYIYFFYYAGALITETFYITCILWTFDAGFRLVHSDSKANRWTLWLELGVAIGLTVLLRQLFLLFLPFLYIWIWWNLGNMDDIPWKKKIHWSNLKGLMIPTIVLALMILPFTIRNYRAFGTFVLLNTNAGFAFYWGNHPIHGTQFVPLQPVSYQDLIPPELLVLNEGELDRALLQEGIRIVIDDPVRYILLSISRIKEYIKFWPTKESGLISNISRVGSFGILLPFMLLGVGITLARFRTPSFASRRAELLIIYQFFLVYTSIHLLSWTLIRYRLPIDAFLIMFAALSFRTLFWKTRTDNKIGNTHSEVTRENRN